jgi:hypothetical protein
MLAVKIILDRKGVLQEVQTILLQGVYMWVAFYSAKLSEKGV